MGKLKEKKASVFTDDLHTALVAQYRQHRALKKGISASLKSNGLVSEVTHTSPIDSTNR